jgi:hypothetical protein
MTTLSDLERWFSPERLAPYQHVCGGRSERAAELYGWNAEIAAALWHTLGHLEILVRQTMHAHLLAWSYAQHRDDRWYLALDRHLTDRARLDVNTARQRATVHSKGESPGRVVAELSFGFWRYLLSSHYERTLWVPCLRGAFPQLPGVRKHLERPVAELHRLRNRIAHHEPVHSLPIADLREKALMVAGWISADARTWIANGDATPTLLNRRP